MKIIELFAKYDTIMSKHLRRTYKIKLYILISNCMKEMKKEAKYYSIILNYTPDVSHTEQILTLTVRFVFIDLKNKESNVKFMKIF